MDYTIETTSSFLNWINGIKDNVIKRKILARLARLENGNFGDYKYFGEQLYELRFFFGGGIRIYYTINNGQIVLLLAAGNKSTQANDIKKANQLLKQLKQVIK